MSPRRAHSLRPRWVAGVVVTIGLGTVLSACGNDGVSLARQACTHVGRSIDLYQQSVDTASTDPARSAALREQAYVELRVALPLTAQAAGNNGQWQALMTTVSESSRVSESFLVHALQKQCAVADSANPGLPPPPSSVPPPAAPTTP